MTTTPGAPPPADLSACVPSWHDDLASGAPGIALLHTHYAANGQGSWDTANSWLATMGRHPLLDTTDASLFRGVPAVAFALRVSLSAGNPARGTLEVWLRDADAAVAAIARQRLTDATAQLDHGPDHPPARDWNLADGLTGIAAGLLTRDAPEDDLVRDILTYLVQLTVHNEHWNTAQTDSDTGFDHTGVVQHSAWGVRTGAAGVLALLALAADQAITVPYQHEAIDRLCALYEQCSDTPHPRCVPRVRDNITSARRPGGVEPAPRPSWCDGTAGIARALQLAAIVLNDAPRRHRAETAMADCLRDLHQAMQLTDFTVCHGWSGLFHTLRNAAADAHPASPLAATTPHLDTPALLRICDTLPADVGDGLLTGKAGMKLATLTPVLPANTPAGTPEQPVGNRVPRTRDSRARWDDCLLIRRHTNTTGKPRDRQPSSTPKAPG